MYEWSPALARMSVNKINPAKLLNSKWTAVDPLNDEKHFLVTRLEIDKHGEVAHCLLQAVISKRSLPIDWKALEDQAKWIQGWK